MNLDVDRESIVRLLRIATETQKEQEGALAAAWWDGYTRAIEIILDMENE